MTAAALTPGPVAREVTPDDRLGMTLFLAIVLHAMVVLGVSFQPEPVPEARFDSMEVILVTRRSETEPEEADLLAQQNQVGGGDSAEFQRPAAPLPAPLAADQPQVTASPTPPQPRRAAATPTESDTPVEQAAAEPAEGDAPAPTPEQPLLAAARSSRAETVPEREAAPAPARQERPEPQRPQPAAEDKPLPSAAELITSSFALASLNAELQQKLESRSQRPRRKFVSANTKEYKYAAYLEAWRSKVERVGNLNYPDEARRAKLSGSLLLDVSINPNGSVREIIVRRSSGHQSLDDAAVRIVQLAAPFAPFPDNIAREVDILHITRTWQFLGSARFSGR
ncbi:MAG: energy transducer TonB [Gammaproteobacteria bacterium]|nr:energy transducer TonB [Gammaproteobacteria bacterium]NNL99487.1 energy transducer TonB [Gammaproteobacteria bacterium]